MIFDSDRLSSLVRHSGSLCHDQEVKVFDDMDELGSNITSQFANVAALIVKHKQPHADESLRNRLSESISHRLKRIACRRRKHEN